MMNHSCNMDCPCLRCRLSSQFWPTIMVTVGVLLLLDNITNRLNFHHTWPLLLIIVGGLKVLQSSASTEGHMEQGTIPPGSIPPMPPAPAAGGNN